MQTVHQTGNHPSICFRTFSKDLFMPFKKLLKNWKMNLEKLLNFTLKESITSLTK
ncbi:hypothetical protein HOLleu_26397 [Holothuria leucospilota]|uniref:Uncharacterized protein n=1 Tax=Holothuria leucospilota TaxID=206669 RepID=A0A9Q1H2T6_HOLLE|nr:hypothetical protein HOLleu_26397 [Holothuria leucospilota]